MAGKSNRGRNRKGSQQAAMDSSEQTFSSQQAVVDSSDQAVSSDAPLSGSSSTVQANGDTNLNECNHTNSEVKNQDNASHQHPTKQGGIDDALFCCLFCRIF